MKYHLLKVTCFTDTTFSNTKSRVGNKAAEVFFTDDGWIILFPMNKGNGKHESLTLLFHREGVPNAMEMYGVKPQVQGDFRRKLRNAGCHIQQNEHYTAMFNLGEGGVHELKRGAVK
jgi:hypothetical protein